MPGWPSRQPVRDQSRHCHIVAGSFERATGDADDTEVHVGWARPGTCGDRARARGDGLRDAEAGGVQGGLDLRRATHRRRLVAGARRRPAEGAEGARVQGDDDLQGERARRPTGRAGDREPDSRRQQDDLRDVVRVPDGDGRGRQETPRRVLRDGDGDGAVQEHGGVLRRQRGRDLPVRDGGRSGHEEGHDRLHRPLPDPGGDPPRERLHAGRAGGAEEREGAPRLDALLVRPEEGAASGGEPRRGGR